MFEVTGTYAGGGTISGAWQIDTNPSTIVVGPGWDNLVSVTFERTPGEGLDSAFYLSGIELTVVPIPAAVWLMLSALGSLGWLSRRA
ncbi:MAG: hypothetical protein HKN56_11110 [Gammaproteobacteria bacterium]|nr:hypothetical protein [Gammaproteobacteria bacterium]